MLSRNKKLLLVIIILALFAGGNVVLYRLRHRVASPQPPPHTDVTFSKPEDKPVTSNANEPVRIPASLLIKVPFTPQAPTANWDELHNEACEEASAIMADAYFHSSTDMSPQNVETEITRLTKWQDDHQGYHLDQTSEEAAKMIEAVYGLRTEVVPLSETAVKQALSENKLVVVSFNGQLLNNPHYKQPGPIHHMLVLTGWTDSQIITNDSGTKFGADYQYDYKTLYSAAADWNHSIDSVDSSQKIAIIISK
jgi:Peptidase_C39 like family